MKIARDLLESVVNPPRLTDNPAPKATLIAWTKNPLRVLAFTDAYCHGKTSIPEYDIVIGRDDELRYFDSIKFDFASIAEMVSFVFALENIPAAFLAQLSRHRFISMHVQTLRVDDQSQFKAYLPDEIAVNVKASEIYAQAMDASRLAYSLLREAEVSPEMARGVLPVHVYYKMVIAVNLRVLIQLASQRLCYIAQPSFWRPFLNSMKSELESKVDPVLGTIFVPLCAMKGTCLSPREQGLRVTGRVEYPPCPIFEKHFNADGSQKHEEGAAS